ncbi:MAG: 4-hydroxybenzoate polyprenyltransferase [Saprospiraceae bacterium]|jgi:4-hydroxybenzoate polyprenyltransferase
MIQKLISLSALFRLPNLLILALSVYIYSYDTLYPSLAAGGMHGSLRFKDFILLLFIIMCTGAGGYIHNDILDRKSDSINEKRGIVGNNIKLSLAWIYYWFVVVAPIPFVFSLSSEISNFNYIYAYLIVVFLLFAYNRFLKRLPLIGNITVASLCTYVFLLPITIEISKMQSLKSINPSAFQNCLKITLCFSFFVFLTHLIREIIKDAEDLEGDKSSGFMTLPVLISAFNLRNILLVLEGILLLGILYWVSAFNLWNTITFINLILLTPLTIWIIYRTYTAELKTDYGYLSVQLKYLMMAGIVSLSITNL